MLASEMSPVWSHIDMTEQLDRENLTHTHQFKQPSDDELARNTGDDLPQVLGMQALASEGSAVQIQPCDAGGRKWFARLPGVGVYVYVVAFCTLAKLLLNIIIHNHALQSMQRCVISNDNPSSCG